MREIKFRAWDNNSKQIVYVGHHHARTTAEMIYMFEDEDLMQYTGLKDKNGKEIYEGDIVKYSDKLVKDQICEVPLLRDCFTTNEIGYDLENISTSECEVIGNIYENPDLLK